MTTSTKNHDEFSFEVGIAKRVDTDVIFSELISNKFFKSENALHSHMPYSVYHHDMIHLVDYKTAIIEPLSSIVHIINGKRKLLFDIIQQNPYITRNKLILYMWKRSLFWERHARSGWMIHFYIFTLLTILIFIPIISITTLIELCTCRNNEDRIQKYNEWVLQNLKDKSDCDTFVLDEIVHDEMERLIGRLSLKYQDHRIYYHHCHYWPRHRLQFIEEEHFMIRFILLKNTE